MQDGDLVVGGTSQPGGGEEFAARGTVEKRYPVGYASTAATMIVSVICLLTGVLHLLLQRFPPTVDTAKNPNEWFVSMLLAGTMILMLGLRSFRKYLIHQGRLFYYYVDPEKIKEPADKLHSDLCRSVMNFRGMTIVGIIYGLIVGSAPFVKHVWPNDPLLQGSLALFMFCVNFATGVGFYGLVVFFRHSIKMGQWTVVDLWNTDNASTKFLLGATRRLSLLASVYVSLCLSSVLFSELPFEDLMIAYSIFAAVIILASLAIPSYPVFAKLRDAKARALVDLDEEINRVFYTTLNGIRSSEIDPKDGLEKCKSLLSFRERVEAVNTLPFKVKSISAAASVILFSAVPVLLQVVLDRLFQTP